MPLRQGKGPRRNYSLCQASCATNLKAGKITEKPVGLKLLKGQKWNCKKGTLGAAGLRKKKLGGIVFQSDDEGDPRDYNWSAGTSSLWEVGLY